MIVGEFDGGAAGGVRWRGLGLWGNDLGGGAWGGSDEARQGEERGDSGMEGEASGVKLALIARVGWGVIEHEGLLHEAGLAGFAGSERQALRQQVREGG